MFVNIFKTAILLSILSGLLALIGALIGGTSGIQVALFISLLINGIAFFFSDRIVLSMYNAQPLDEYHYAWIYDIVKELSGKMNIPMPKLWIVANATANAFATGRNPKHASVAITTGILHILDAEELRGVLAHETLRKELGAEKGSLSATCRATPALAKGGFRNADRTLWPALWM